MPPVWLSSRRREIRSAWAMRGNHLASRSSRLSCPSSLTLRINAAVKVFVMLYARNAGSRSDSGCGSRKFQLGEDGYAESRSTLEFDYESGAPPRVGRGHGSALRSIRFTLVPVAHGNGLQKFQAARRSYR